MKKIGEHFLKPSGPSLTPRRKKSKRIGSGKKTKQWEKIRAELKIKFQAAGITRCELRLSGCWRDDGLGFCHALKRRFCDEQELRICILGCNNCHDRIEGLPHVEMRQIVLDTINARVQQP